VEAIIDNDVLHKLARYDLLQEFDALLSSRGHVAPYGRLASAPYALRATATRVCPAKWPNPSQAAALCSFLSARTQNVVGASADALIALDVLSFDVGEAQLTAYVMETPRSLLFTGDKKALEVIATNPNLAHVCAALQGRVICLEQILRDLTVTSGWADIAQHVKSDAAADTTLTRCFRGITQAVMSTDLCLNVQQLRTRSGGLLVP
jgi:hypothetical protein